MTFLFSAKPGYYISEVYVNGNAISAEDLATGAYTFTNVQYNNTIDVVSVQGQPITVTVDIVGGRGTAEYRIGPSGQYNGFLRTQSILPNSDLFVTVVPDSGYIFLNWTGDVSSTDSELEFPSVTHDIHLTANLEDLNPGSSADNGKWAVLNIIFAVLALFVGIIAVFAILAEKKEDRSAKAAILRVVALIVGIVAVAIFFVTENIHQSMGAYDAWTPVALILFALALFFTVWSFRLNRK